MKFHGLCWTRWITLKRSPARRLNVQSYPHKSSIEDCLLWTKIVYTVISWWFYVGERLYQGYQYLIWWKWCSPAQYWSNLSEGQDVEIGEILCWRARSLMSYNQNFTIISFSLRKTARSRCICLVGSAARRVNQALFGHLSNHVKRGTVTMRTGEESDYSARLKTPIDNGIVYVPVRTAKNQGCRCWNYRFTKNISFAQMARLVNVTSSIKKVQMGVWAFVNNCERLQRWKSSSWNEKVMNLSAW